MDIEWVAKRADTLISYLAGRFLRKSDVLNLFLIIKIFILLVYKYFEGQSYLGFYIDWFELKIINGSYFSLIFCNITYFSYC